MPDGTTCPTGSCGTGGCGTGGWAGPLPGDPSNIYGLSAVGMVGGVEVSWGMPTLNPHAVAFIELFRGINSNIGLATRLATVNATQYFDKTPSGEEPRQYFYWARQVSVNGTVGDWIGPASATAIPEISHLLDELEGQINSSQLAGTLRSQIESIQLLRNDLVAGMAALAGDDQALSAVIAQLDGAVTDALALLANETAARVEQTAALASQIDAEIQERVDALADEAQARADAIADEALARSDGDLAEARTRVAADMLETRNRIAATEASAEALLRSVLAQEAQKSADTSALALAKTELRERIEAGLVSEASSRLTLAAKLGTDIASTQALVYEESTARTTAVEAEAAQRNLLAAQFRGTYEGTDINQVTSGLLYQERIARATEDQALATQIFAMTAGVGEQFDWKTIWYFDAGVESWTGNGTPTATGGFLRPANQASGAYVESPGGLAVEGAKYPQVRLRIKKTGTVTWAGWLYWKGTGDTTWDSARRVALPEPTWDSNGIGLVTVSAAWSATVQQIRIDLSSAQTASNYMELDWVAIGRPSPGASSAQLQEIQTTQAGINSALASDITSLSAQVNDEETGLGAAFSAISKEATVRASGDSANANAITSLASRVSDAETGLATAQADILTEAETRADADDALAENITTLSAQVNNPTTGLPATRSELQTFQSTQATENAATAKEVRTLKAAAQDADGAALSALLLGEAVRQESTAGIALVRQELQSNIVAGQLAEASAREVLAAAVAQSTALIVEEQRTRATATEALATDLTSLQAAVGSNFAAITEETTVRATQTSALATSLETLTAAVDDAEASITSLAETMADADEALASRTDALEATVDDPTTGLPATRSTLLTFQTAQATLNGGFAQDVRSLRTGAQDTDETTLAALLAGETVRSEVSAGLALARQELQTNIEEGIRAESAAREVLAATVGQSLATVLTEQRALATQTEAVAGTVEVLNAAVGSNTAEIISTQNALSTATSSLAQSITTLDSQVNDETTGLSATRATLVSGYYTKVGTDNAISASLASLNATVFDEETGLEATRATLLNSYYTSAETDSAIAAASLTLSSSIAGVSSNLANNYYTKAGTDSAISNATLNLVSATALSNALGDYATTSTLTNNYYTKSAADSAISAAVMGLVSTTALNTALGNYVTSANLTNNYYTKSETNSAISSATSTLVSTTALSNALGSYTTTAALQTNYYTKTAVDSAISSEVSTLSAQVGEDISSAIQSVSEVIADLDGDVRSLYTLRTEVSGAGGTVIGGFGLAGTSTAAGGATIDFGVVANRFYVAAPAGSGLPNMQPFVLQMTSWNDNGVVRDPGLYVSSANITRLTAGQINAEGLTIPNGSIRGGGFSSFSWPIYPQGGFCLSGDGLRLGNYYTGRFFEVYSNGDIAAPGLTVIGGAATFSGSLSAATGTFSGTLTASAINAVSTINIGLDQVTVPRTYSTTVNYLGNNTDQTVLSYVFTMPAAGAVIVLWAGQQSYSGTNAFTTKFKLNGVEIGQTRGGAAPQDAPFGIAFGSAVQGSNTISVTWNAGGGIALDEQYLVVLGAQR